MVLVKWEGNFDTVVRLIFELIIDSYEITSHMKLAEKVLHDFVNMAKLDSLQFLQEAKNTREQIQP